MAAQRMVPNSPQVSTSTLTSLRLLAALKRRLRKSAAAERRTKSAKAELLIEEGLDREEAAKSGKKSSRKADRNVPHKVTPAKAGSRPPIALETWFPETTR